MTEGVTPQQSKRDKLQDWLRFFCDESNVLRERQQLLFQQPGNQPGDSVVALAAKQCWAIGAQKRAWLRWINKPQDSDPCIMTLTGHQHLWFFFFTYYSFFRIFDSSESEFLSFEIPYWHVCLRQTPLKARSRNRRLL